MHHPGHALHHGTSTRHSCDVENLVSDATPSAKLTSKHKQLSKSNESISSLTTDDQNRQNSKSANVFFKTANQTKSDDSDEKSQRSNRIKQQTHYYQKLQQNEFADLLSLRDAALANKTNRLASCTSAHQLKSLSNGNKPSPNSQLSKFKPIHNNHSNNENNTSNTSNNKVKHYSSEKKFSLLIWKWIFTLKK